ncbi:hypothetical protein SUNI508_04803 [Seiridium unicorne]|uniref:Uncharacterized protein n=1 Tax=Seiridium unicorne TaxID=138068 RepID=A0ABR2V6B1_9PEZI
MGSLFISGSEARFGALNVPGVIALPPLPNIISEWFAIVPLICHLATPQDDHVILGEICFLGRIPVGLFPRLGTLSGLARLLCRGQEFFDGATTKGGISQTVWDVQWGSVFPAANGSVSAAVIQFIRSRRKPTAILMPEHYVKRGYHESRNESSTSESTQAAKELPATMPEHFIKQDDQNSRNDSSSRESNPTAKELPAKMPEHRPQQINTQFRRYQTLHVLRFGRQEHRTSARALFRHLVASKWFGYLSMVFKTVVAIIFYLCGLYGTATVLLTSTISQIFANTIQLQRPCGYLENNEHHDACMLLAPHQNALEWYLFVGDRYVVDTMLNKSMLHLILPQQVMACWWFNVAHVLQIAAMTFTAGQKGWDAVFLVLCLVFDRIGRWYHRSTQLASDWLQGEGVEVDSHTFQFTGRAVMLGAIQLYSGTKVTTWMDDIMVPHPRRDAWLDYMKTGEITHEMSDTDIEWIERTACLSSRAADAMAKEIH